MDGSETASRARCRPAAEVRSVSMVRRITSQSAGAIKPRRLSAPVQNSTMRRVYFPCARGKAAGREPPPLLLGALVIGTHGRPEVDVLAHELPGTRGGGMVSATPAVPPRDEAEISRGVIDGGAVVPPGRSVVRHPMRVPEGPVMATGAGRAESHAKTGGAVMPPESAAVRPPVQIPEEPVTATGAGRAESHVGWHAVLLQVGTGTAAGGMHAEAYTSSV